MGDLDTVYWLFDFVGAVLHFLGGRELLTALVLKSNDLPSLLKVVILVVHFAVWLIQSLGVVDPVRATLVYDGK